MMSPPPGASNDGPERPWFDDDSTAVEDRPADSAANLVSLRFITAALRRSAWFWRVTAVAGLLVGAGLYLKTPHPYQASTTLLLAVGPEQQPGTAILNDQAIAHSHTVAGLARDDLGLRQSVSSFLGSYTATTVTDRVLTITASAPSSKEAVRRASVLATQFLAFRARQLQAEQQLETAALDQLINQGEQQVRSISKQISQLSAQPASSSRQAKLSALRTHSDRANNNLAALKQTTAATLASTKVATATMVEGSKVLDAASPTPTPPHSRLKHLALYIGGGFLIGLILGLALVAARAVLSDRLRRRDDVAQALGAPVSSVPAMRASWLPSRRGRVSGRYRQRIVAHLRNAVPDDARSLAALAVVPVDDSWVAAQSVVSLAVRCAQQGTRVVVADLCVGAPAAMLLGARGSGVHMVSVDGAQLVAAVPDPTEFAPVGPLKPTSSQAQSAIASELAAASASADLLLTLITLDPSVGGEHLATWAADAVVMVTAGQSSWTKIYAVGEMIRLAGTRLASALLVGADKIDESLGVSVQTEANRDAVTTQGMQADVETSFAESLGGRPSDGPASRLQMDPPEHVGHRRRTGR